MHLPEILRRRSGPALGAAVALGLVAAGGASAQTAQSAATAAHSAPDAVIVVYPTHMRWAGDSYDDLDTLAAAVLPRTPRNVGLFSCGDGAARLQKAAAHRFRDLPLELRVLDSRSAPCDSQDGSRVASLAPGPGIRVPVVDDAAVERWWSRQVP